MQRTPVYDSTDLASIGYDAEEHILEVEFHRGGVYQYLNVPPAEYERLMRTNSKGRYLHDNIRKLYPYRRPPSTDPTTKTLGNQGEAEAKRRLARFIPAGDEAHIGNRPAPLGGKAAWSFLGDTDDVNPKTGE